MSLSLLSRKIFDHYRHSTPLFYFDSIDSTNDEAMRQLEATAHGRVAVVAASQTHGRGRRGHTWVSDPNGNLYASIGLKLTENPQNLGLLGINFGLILCEAVECVTGISLKIKWPNDLWYEDKKVAGILVESKRNPTLHVVIGFGLNVHTAVIVNNNSTTALAQIQALTLSTDALCAALLEKILNTDLLDTTSLQQKWSQRDALMGRSIVVQADNNALHGIADGIQSDGQLRLQTSKNFVLVPSGSVRLAHLY